MRFTKLFIAPLAVAVFAAGLASMPAASALAGLNGDTKDGLGVLDDFVEDNGDVLAEDTFGTDGGGIGSKGDSGLVITLPGDASGIVWMDDPYGFDLGLGLPSQESRKELYCPQGGWKLLDVACVKRIPYAYQFENFEYKYTDYVYDYTDYTFLEQEYTFERRAYEYNRQSYTYTRTQTGNKDHVYPADIAQSTGTLCPWGGEPNREGDLCVVAGGGDPIYENILNDTPTGWEDSGTDWFQLKATPAGWEDNGTGWERRNPTPTGWTDTGFNWEQRNPTPTGWTDTGDEWRKLQTPPAGWNDYNSMWRALIDNPGWLSFNGQWRKLATPPAGFRDTTTDWVASIPARTRLAPLDATPAVDTAKLDPSATPNWSLIGQTQPTDVTVTETIAETKAVRVNDATVVYEDTQGDGAVAAQILNDNSVRLAVVIPNENSPRSFTVPLHMPDFMAPALQTDGTVLIMALLAKDDPETVDVDETLWEIEYEMPTPWAKDANGNDIKTWYSLEGLNLTQTIEPNTNTAWPVTADPTAKQKQQAATARNQAAIAEKQADKAIAAKTAAIQARERAERKAFNAQQLLLKAQETGKNREENARLAAKNAAAAKRAADEAVKQARIAKEAARKAEMAAQKAAGAAKKLAESNAKKLAREADKDAKTAKTAKTTAVDANKIAQRQATAVNEILPIINQTQGTANRVVAIYEDTTKTTQQKIAASQTVLNTYVRILNNRTINAERENKKNTTPPLNYPLNIAPQPDLTGVVDLEITSPLRLDSAEPTHDVDVTVTPAVYRRSFAITTTDPRVNINTRNPNNQTFCTQKNTAPVTCRNSTNPNPKSMNGQLQLTTTFADTKPTMAMPLILKDTTTQKTLDTESLIFNPVVDPRQKEFIEKGYIQIKRPYVSMILYSRNGALIAFESTKAIEGIQRDCIPGASLKPGEGDGVAGTKIALFGITQLDSLLGWSTINEITTKTGVAGIDAIMAKFDFERGKYCAAAIGLVLGVASLFKGSPAVISFGLRILLEAALLKSESTRQTMEEAINTPGSCFADMTFTDTQSGVVTSQPLAWMEEDGIRCE